MFYVDNDKTLLRAARVLAALRSLPQERISKFERDNCITDLEYAIRERNFRLIEALLITSPYNWVA